MGVLLYDYFRLQKRSPPTCPWYHSAEPSPNGHMSGGVPFRRSFLPTFKRVSLMQKPSSVKSYMQTPYMLQPNDRRRAKKIGGIF